MSIICTNVSKKTTNMMLDKQSNELLTNIAYIDFFVTKLEMFLQSFIDVKRKARPVHELYHEGI